MFKQIVFDFYYLYMACFYLDLEHVEDFLKQGHQCL